MIILRDFIKHAMVPLLAALCFVLCMQEAYAQATRPIPLYQCTTIGNTNAITANIISCMNVAIRGATFELLGYVSNYMAPIVSAVSLYAILIHGIKILGGAGQLTAQTATLLLRLGAVNFFFWNLGGVTADGNFLGAMPFHIMDELASTVGGSPFGNNPCTDDKANFPWSYIDCFLGQIFGFDSNNSGNRLLYHGVLGMSAAALFSGTTGIAMTFSAILALFELLMFGLDILYTYLIAVLVLAVCIALSPVIIPLALFNYADKYFKKWLANMIAAILIPALLFGFLCMTLQLFALQISDVLSSLNPSRHYDSNGLDFYPPYAIQDNSMFTWMQRNSDSYAKMQHDVYEKVHDADPRNVPATNSNMSSKASNESMVNAFSFWGLQFGEAPTSNIFKVVIQFVTLWIYSSVLIGMIRKIPAIAQDMAGALQSIDMKRQSIAQRVGGIGSNMKMGGGALIGGVTGGGLASILTKSSKGRQLGTVAGAAMGALIGRRA